MFEKGDKVRRKKDKLLDVGWCEGDRILTVRNYGKYWIQFEESEFTWNTANFELVTVPTIEEEIAGLEAKLKELKDKQRATSYKEGLAKALATFTEKMESTRPLYGVNQNCHVTHGDYVFQMTARLA